MNEDDTSTSVTAEDDERPTYIIRAKWLMDGATTLAEAADRLQAQAEHLRQLHEQGWTFENPVDDDYGFLLDPSGNPYDDQK